MALSPDAAALKEQALHAADIALIHAPPRTELLPSQIRVVIAVAWLDGYKTGQMEADRYVDEARLWLSALAAA